VISVVTVDLFSVHDSCRFTAAVVVPLAGKFGILNPMWLILDYYGLVNRFQVSH